MQPGHPATYLSATMDGNIKDPLKEGWEGGLLGKGCSGLGPRTRRKAFLHVLVLFTGEEKMHVHTHSWLLVWLLLSHQ